MVIMRIPFSIIRSPVEIWLKDSSSPCSIHCLSLRRNTTLSNMDSEKPKLDEEQFRVIELIKKRTPMKRSGIEYEKFFKQPREKSQPVNQDWGNVWPGIKSFHPATVPLPVRMGYPNNKEPSPDKWANAELMKIPNFLHLTPPVIERQCQALKKFCTQWPKELENEEAQKHHFPVRVRKSSYLHSSPSIRDDRARVVTYSVFVKNLGLDSHALDKLLRLVGDRYDPPTDTLTLVADRCPLSSQNFDYCEYLLTVLYKESLKTEPWEHNKHDLDYETFDFERSDSKKSLKNMEEISGAKFSEDNVQEYAIATTKLHNEGEDKESLKLYKNTVLKVLSL